MTAKEYLSQAFYIDGGINSKLEQLSALQTLALKATSHLSRTPISGSKDTHQLEEVVCKMIDLESEISKEMKKLLELKKEIMSVINSVSNSDYKILLEFRYLCFHSWEKIAVEMGYDKRYILKMHNRALNFIKLDTKRHF